MEDSEQETSYYQSYPLKAFPEIPTTTSWGRVRSDDSLHSKQPLRSSLYQFRVTLALMVVTAIWIGFTIFYAYNATVDPPVSRKLLSSSPANTILAINVLSHITIFLLQVLCSDVFEGIRWALASGGGIPMSTFLSLSRATSPVGVLYLLLHRAKSKLGIFRGHHFWGLKRYFPRSLL